MQNWKEAYWLSKFELRKSGKSIVFTLLVLSFFLLFFTVETEDYIETGLVIYDFLFLIAFGSIVYWMRPKAFQYQKVQEDVWASPYLIQLNHLPIPQDILLKSRFLTYFIIAIPFNLFLLIMLYFISPLGHHLLSFGEYVAFSIIWFSFGIYFGSIYPASDVGDYIKPLRLYVYGFLLIVGFMGALILIRVLSGYGIVYWTMVVAAKWPVISSVLSLIGAYAGYKYWFNAAKRQMNRFDYY